MPVGQHGLLAICYVFLTPVKDTKKVQVYFLFLITRRYLHSNFIITLKEITEIPTEFIVGILELFIYFCVTTLTPLSQQENIDEEKEEYT